MISVVLAGGRGTRLWPESTVQRPKQMCYFSGQRSLLNMTIRRLSSLGSLLVVCGQDQLELVNTELEDHKTKVICEPAGKNTAPAVGLVLSGEDIADSEILGFFPSDHLISDDREFIRVIREAERVARDGYLVTIGIAPEGPVTGYGYIERLSDHDHEVNAFHEKPDLETAKGYVNSGNYYWNAGIFIAEAKTWRALIEEHLPEQHLQMIKGRDGYINSYDLIPDISIDHGIAEKCGKMAVIPGSFGWNDVGSWDSLARVLEADENGNAVSGDVLVVDCTNCLARSRDKKLVLFGMGGIIAVETEEAILVCPRERCEEIKKLADTL